MKAMAVWVVLMAAAAPAAAQEKAPEAVTKTFQTRSGQRIQIGTYTNVKPDCVPGPLPILRLTEEPKGGRVQVRRAQLRLTNQGKCLAVDAPGYVAFYAPRQGFVGTDTAVLEILNARGELVQRQRFEVSVSAPGNAI